MRINDLPCGFYYVNIQHNMKNITKEQFICYENVRLSGATNMFNVGEVAKLSGLSVKIILIIMKGYEKLKNRFQN